MTRPKSVASRQARLMPRPGPPARTPKVGTIKWLNSMECQYSGYGSATIQLIAPLAQVSFDAVFRHIEEGRIELTQMNTADAMFFECAIGDDRWAWVLPRQGSVFNLAPPKPIKLR